MPGRYTLDLLAAKVSWEGGILDTLDYGICSDDIADPEMADLWGQLERVYESMAPLMRQIDRRLREARAPKPEATE